MKQRLGAPELVRQLQPSAGWWDQGLSGLDVHFWGHRSVATEIIGL